MDVKPPTWWWLGKVFMALSSWVMAEVSRLTGMASARSPVVRLNAHAVATRWTCREVGWLRMALSTSCGETGGLCHDHDGLRISKCLCLELSHWKLSRNESQLGVSVWRSNLCNRSPSCGVRLLDSFCKTPPWTASLPLITSKYSHGDVSSQDNLTLAVLHVQTELFLNAPHK